MTKNEDAIHEANVSRIYNEADRVLAQSATNLALDAIATLMASGWSQETAIECLAERIEIIQADNDQTEHDYASLTATLSSLVERKTSNQPYG